MTLEFRNFYFPNRHHRGMDGQTGLTTYPFFSNLFHKQTDLVSQLEFSSFSGKIRAFQLCHWLFRCCLTAHTKQCQLEPPNLVNHAAEFRNFLHFSYPKRTRLGFSFYLFIYFILFFPKKSQIYLGTLFYFAFLIAHLGREKTTSICKPSHRPQSSS